MSDTSSEVRDYSTELETGIFNMIITLCQHYEATMPLTQAKERTADYLHRIVKALREGN